MATTESDLPDEIIHLIASRVSGILGLKRFGAVSQRWRIAAKEVAKLPPQFPMLLLPSEDGKLMNRLAFSFEEKKAYNFPLPGSCPIASSDEVISSPDGGWFLISGGHGLLHLVNPVNGTSVDLPSLPLKKTPPLKKTQVEEEDVKDPGFLKAKILSTGIVAVLDPDYYEGLRVCKLGQDEKSWGAIRIPRQYSVYADFVFSGGRFYVSNWGVLSIFNGVNLHHLKDVPLTSEQWEFACSDYLVRSPKGDLLLLRRTPNWKKGARFLIFILKLVDGEYKWFKVKDFRNTTFFVDAIQALAFDSRQVKECQGSSIYFVDDCDPYEDNKRSVKVFDIKKRQVLEESVCTFSSGACWKDFTWLFPGL